MRDTQSFENMETHQHLHIIYGLFICDASATMVTIKFTNSVNFCDTPLKSEL